MIDENINNKTYFKSLYDFIEDLSGKIIYNHKYYFISYITYGRNIIIIINSNNFTDIKIFIKKKIMIEKFIIIM